MTDTDLLAEAQILGMTLSAPMAVRERFLACGADCWTSFQHGEIAAAMTDIYRRQAPVDVPSVQRATVKRVGTDDAARRISLYIYELFATSAPLTSFDYYFDRLERITRARRAMNAATLFRQRVANALEVDDEEAYSRAVADLTEAAEDAAASSMVTAEPPMSYADLMQVSERHDWLVPNLLERTDRMMLTGWEGLGKSELICQFACTIASGLHPFTGRSIRGDGQGERVLVVDAENAQRQIRRRYGRVGKMVDELRRKQDMEPTDWNVAMRFVIRPEGIPLSTPRELARLEQAIATMAPTLVVAGPIYKLSNQDTRDEQAARELTVVLDRLRQRHQFALLLEAHSGHGSSYAPRSVRPTGSSLFLRWPEFGYGIKPSDDEADKDSPNTVKVVSWRGPREERAWPKWLSKSWRLPWEPAEAHYSDQMDDDVKELERAK